MIKLSVNEKKWSSLLARTRALILYISILIFDFGPEKLPRLSRRGPRALSTRLHLNEGVYETLRRTAFEFQYKLYGKILETVDATKYLGIYLSHDITLE